MIDLGFRDLTQSITDLRNKQATRHAFFMAAKIAVPNGGEAKAFFVPDQDADFEIKGLVGAVVAPSNAAGVRYSTGVAQSLFPLNGVSPANGYAERGLIMRVYDGKSGLQLSDPEPDSWERNVPANPLLDAKSYLQPGYRIGCFSQPQVFKYYLRKASKLVFQFYNNDTVNLVNDNPVQVYHTVSLVLSGRKCDSGTR